MHRPMAIRCCSRTTISTCCSNYLDMLQQHVENLPYDPGKDFVPIARINHAPIGVVVRGDSPFKTFDDVVEYCQGQSGQTEDGAFGQLGRAVRAGRADHEVEGHRFQHDTLTRAVGRLCRRCSKKGDAEITMGFPATLTNLLDNGEVRLLATAGSERMVDDVPTLAELGVEGDTGYMHRVVVAPAGTPPDVVQRQRDAFKALQEDKSYVRLMGRLG